MARVEGRRAGVCAAPLVGDCRCENRHVFCVGGGVRIPLGRRAGGGGPWHLGHLNNRDEKLARLRRAAAAGDRLGEVLEPRIVFFWGQVAMVGSRGFPRHRSDRRRGRPRGRRSCAAMPHHRGRPWNVPVNKSGLASTSSGGNGRVSRARLQAEGPLAMHRKSAPLWIPSREFTSRRSLFVEAVADGKKDTRCRPRTTWRIVGNLTSSFESWTAGSGRGPPPRQARSGGCVGRRAALTKNLSFGKRVALESTRAFTARESGEPPCRKRSVPFPVERFE